MRPGAVDLIEEARRTLAEVLAPALTGRERALALMASRALALALEDLRAPPPPAPDAPDLVERLRAGALDGSDAAYRSLGGPVAADGRGVP